MNKASRTIALVLIPLGLIFLGYQCSPRRPDGSYGGPRGFFFRSGGGYSSGGGSHPSSSSSISRGGFGSHGGSIGS